MARLNREQRERLIAEGNRRAHLRMCVQDESDDQMEFEFDKLHMTHHNRVTRRPIMRHC